MPERTPGGFLQSAPGGLLLRISGRFPKGTLSGFSERIPEKKMILESIKSELRENFHKQILAGFPAGAFGGFPEETPVRNPAGNYGNEQRSGLNPAEPHRCRNP